MVSVSDTEYELEVDSETLAQIIELSISGATLEYEITGIDDSLKTNTAGEDAAAIVYRMDDGLYESTEYKMGLKQVNSTVVEVKANSKSLYPEQEPVTAANNNKTPPRDWREQEGNLTTHFFVNGALPELKNYWERQEQQ